MTEPWIPSNIPEPIEPTKIYVASSWRNVFQPMVVSILRQAKFEVYDFRHGSSVVPSRGERTKGFNWRQIDPNWQQWENHEFIAALDHPGATAGFDADFDAMKEADKFVLVMPCGRSAHLEAGWAIGQDKPTAILLDAGDSAEPELMYKMADCITDSMIDLLGWLGVED